MITTLSITNTMEEQPAVVVVAATSVLVRAATTVLVRTATVLASAATAGGIRVILILDTRDG